MARNLNLDAYERMKDELLQRYRGKAVAIKDGELVGVHEDEVRAFEDVVKRYGFMPAPVLIRRAVEVEEPVDIPAYVNGLMDARPT
ncbi:hypothetical protein NAS2_0699 [Conexivisphaera calida]|uniref:DUF5678 domain-containing protein n=2 Tax=Conexivisphaera calida TaxID=1874277 RepID=A0A4P2VLX9_9ARCH|nr:hypothetical protein NAS2_0699 [Conexivisphaera calida]